MHQVLPLAEDGPIWTKFRSLMHNSAANCPISVKFCLGKEFFTKFRWWNGYRGSTECMSFVFQMQFGLRRAAYLLSSPIHLLRSFYSECVRLSSNTAIWHYKVSCSCKTLGDCSIRRNNNGIFYSVIKAWSNEVFIALRSIWRKSDP